MRVIAIIPARLNSKRFPRKLMEKINGIPLILMTYQNLLSMNIFDEIIIATDSLEISNIIKKKGGNVFISKKKHFCGSDRVFEASNNFKSDIVINVQGDEPFVNPKSINKIINFFSDNLNKKISIVSLIYKTNNPAIIDDENCVKVVTDKNNFAMYFSREPIPSRRMNFSNVPMYKQVCVIPFKRDFLLEYNKMEQTPLEIIESVDMMRVLENGIKIKMVNILEENYSVDTKDDLKNVIKIMKNDNLIKDYI